MSGFFDTGREAVVAGRIALAHILLCHELGCRTSRLWVAADWPLHRWLHDCSAPISRWPCAQYTTNNAPAALPTPLPYAQVPYDARLAPNFELQASLRPCAGHGPELPGESRHKPAAAAVLVDSVTTPKVAAIAHCGILRASACNDYETSRGGDRLVESTQMLTMLVRPIQIKASTYP